MDTTNIITPIHLTQYMVAAKSQRQGGDRTYLCIREACLVYQTQSGMRADDWWYTRRQLLRILQSFVVQFRVGEWSSKNTSGDYPKSSLLRIQTLPGKEDESRWFLGTWYRSRIDELYEANIFVNLHSLPSSQVIVFLECRCNAASTRFRHSNSKL
jgi:hypothetical protein